MTDGLVIPSTDFLPAFKEKTGRRDYKTIKIVGYTIPGFLEAGIDQPGYPGMQGIFILLNDEF